jgi:hypothetical protein
MAKKMYYVETVDGWNLGDVSVRDVNDLARKAEAANRDNMDTFVHQCSLQEGAPVVRFFDDETDRHVGWFSGVTGKFVRRP